MIDTERVCGTSASSAPTVTTSCTPIASLSSTISFENVRQRNDGSVPVSRIRSRGARGTRASYSSTSGHTIRRACPSVSLIRGRVAWKS